jgi:diaminopimelate decarboxylase
MRLCEVKRDFYINLQEALDHGLGAECASIGEVIHALKIGFHPSKIVYDSPCRTRHDIQEAFRVIIRKLSIIFAKTS